MGEDLNSIADSFSGPLEAIKNIDDAVFGLTHSGIKNIEEIRVAINSGQDGCTLVKTATELE